MRIKLSELSLSALNKDRFTFKKTSNAKKAMQLAWDVIKAEMPSTVSQEDFCKDFCIDSSYQVVVVKGNELLAFCYPDFVKGEDEYIWISTTGKKYKICRSKEFELVPVEERICSGGEKIVIEPDYETEEVYCWIDGQFVMTHYETLIEASVCRLVD